jgi:acetyl/propionyl-CoA carboxylase alpha subunit
MRRALGEYRVLGITTNLALFDTVMNDPDFVAGHLHTGFLDGYAERLWRGIGKDEALACMLAAARMEPDKTQQPPSSQSRTAWQIAGRRGLLQ